MVKVSEKKCISLLCFSVFAVGNEESNCIKKNNYLLFLTQWEITLHLCFFHFGMEFIKTILRTENRDLPCAKVGSYAHCEYLYTGWSSDGTAFFVDWSSNFDGSNLHL